MAEIPIRRELVETWGYEGLERCEPSQLMLQIVLVPPFHHEASWSVFDVGQDRLRVRRVQVPPGQYGDPLEREVQMFGSDGMIETGRVGTLVDDLGHVEVPATAATPAGIDGCAYLVSQAPIAHRITGKQWNDFSDRDGFAAITDWFYTTIDVLDVVLPAYSQRVPRWKRQGDDPSPTWRGY